MKAQAMDLRRIARLLGGEVAGRGRILCPGPGHTRRDRSLSVAFVGADEPIVHSFAGDDWRACRDHVARLLGQLAEIGPRPLLRVPHRTPVERKPDQDDARRSEIALAIWQSAKPAQGNAGRDLSRITRHRPAAI